MSRHYKKIIDLIKAEEDSKYDTISKDSSFQDIENIFTSGKDISEKEYLDIMTGKHQRVPAWNINESLGKILALSSNNNPQTNSKALKAIHESKDDEGDYDGAFKHLSARGNLKGEDISKFIDGTYVDARERDNEIIKNPNLRTQHLEEFAEKNPNQIESVMNHENYSPKMLTNLLNKENFRDQLDGYNIDAMVKRNMKGYNLNGDAIPDQEQSLDLHPTAVRQLIEHAGDKARTHSLNVLLDHADPTFKKQWTDEKLGITHGSHGHTFPEDYENGTESPNFKEENWANWSIDDVTKYDEGTARFLAGSRHIDDDQAEHIKRHADIDQKYKLYENKHVDPRHGAEMFKKWHDDDHNHGYDAGELNEYHKKNHRDKYTLDDLDPSVLEEIKERGHEDGEIREDAERQYDIYEYLRDEEDSIVDKMGSKYDDMDEIHETLHENHDWTEENPDAAQNIGNPEYDKLNEIHEEYGDSNSYLTPGEAKVEKWSDIGIDDSDIDDDGDVHIDTIKEALDKFGGPAQIDYANHDDYTISDHPEYDDRYEEAAKDWRRNKLQNDASEIIDDMYLYEDHMESDGYREAEAEAEKDYLENNAGDYFDELFDSSHQDTRFVPSHLHNHIENFSEIQGQQKTKNLDGPNRKFLNEHIKDRSYEHEYGDNQHHHEMVRDYAEANGGSIDIGTMNKLHPNQKDIWKKIFDGKGKISSEEAGNKLNSLPKTKYEISYGKWDQGKMQNLNNRDQIIMRLDHSNDSIKPLMEDSELYDTFKRVQDTSQQSGHPTRSNTIAWARVDTTDPNHWMIDEVQSDFGKTVTRYLKKEGADDKASHIEKISDHHKNWREALTNAVLKEAKKHGAEKVSTHSPESKHAHAAYGSSNIHSVYKDSYKKVPRSMGFRPVKHTELPLSDRGRQYFVKEDSNRLNENNAHRDAHEYHHEMAGTYQNLANKGWGDKAIEFSNQHKNLMEQHRERANISMPSQQIKPKGFDDLEHKRFNRMENVVSAQSMMKEVGHINNHDNDNLLQNPPTEFKDTEHQGHTYDLNPKFLKKNMDDFLELYETLEKGDGANALKGGLIALAMAHGAHYMGQDSPKEKAAKQFAGGNIPSHARSVANIEHKPDVVEQARLDAQKEGQDIIARNDKKWFLSNHADGLSPHVYKQTIKSNPDLNEKYNYTNSLSNNTFKEIIKKNPHLRDDVHNAHYDKLHNEFSGDHEKMAHAWQNGIKATHAKFAPAPVDRQPAQTSLGQQPSQDQVGEPEPNFTHRRARGSR